MKLQSNKELEGNKMIQYKSKKAALVDLSINSIMITDSYKTFHILDSYQKFSDLIKNTNAPKFNEHIFANRPVNFFYDIEIKPNHELFGNHVEFITRVIQETIDFFITFQLESKVTILEAHAADKRSYHLIFHLTNELGPVYFKDVKLLKPFIKKMFPNETDDEVIDVSIYREGNFRTIKSSKPGENRPFVFSTAFSFDFIQNDTIMDTFVQYTVSEYTLFDSSNFKITKIGNKKNESSSSHDNNNIEFTPNDIESLEIAVKNMFNYNKSDISDIKLNGDQIIVGLNDTFCRKKNGNHKSNHQYILIDTTSARQKCHDTSCSNEKWFVKPFNDFPKDIKDLIFRIFKIEEIEIETIQNAKNDCKDAVFTNFKEHVDDFDYNKVSKELRTVAKQSLPFGGDCIDGCDCEYICSSTGYKMTCKNCGISFPQQGTIQIPAERYKGLNIFWQNVNKSVTIINNTNNYNGEEDFSCDVNLDPTIFGGSKELATLYNQILDGHNIVKLSLLLEQYESDFVYSIEWYVFDGSIWKIDLENLKLRSKVINLETNFKKIKQHYEKKPVSDETNNVIKNIKSLVNKLSKPSFQDDIIKTSKMNYLDEDFIGLLNCKKHLVPCNNGVYDLLQHRFRPTTKEDYVNLTFKYDYNASVRNPEVLQFIHEILPNKDERDYILKKMSDCLNGDIPNTNFIMFIGDGANGKSQLLNLMKLAMGQMGEKVEVTLLTRKRKDASDANTEKIKLMYKRFAFLSEPEDGEKFNISLLKELTGSEEIVSRDLYKGSKTFVMECKLFLGCNELPEIKGEDTALWRRIKVVNFSSKFVDDPKDANEFKIDRTLPSRMREDITWRQTFLNILLDYYYIDVPEPDSVKITTNNYREGNDVVLEFVNQKCDLAPGNKEYRIASVTLWDKFQEWIISEESNSKVTQKNFKERLDKLTKDSYKTKLKGIDGFNYSVQGWIGIKLKNN